jgi:hypothetical protein
MSKLGFSSQDNTLLSITSFLFCFRSNDTVPCRADSQYANLICSYGAGIFRHYICALERSGRAGKFEGMR